MYPLLQCNTYPSFNSLRVLFTRIFENTQSQSHNLYFHTHLAHAPMHASVGQNGSQLAGRTLQSSHYVDITSAELEQRVNIGNIFKLLTHSATRPTLHASVDFHSSSPLLKQHDGPSHLHITFSSTARTSADGVPNIQPIFRRPRTHLLAGLHKLKPAIHFAFQPSSSNPAKFSHRPSSIAHKPAERRHPSLPQSPRGHAA